jgi:hypothetical protein
MPANDWIDDDDDAGFGGAAAPVILPTLADGIAAAAGDPDEALDMCRDLASAENLDQEQYLELVLLVEGSTGFELPEEGLRF